VRWNCTYLITTVKYEGLRVHGKDSPAFQLKEIKHDSMGRRIGELAYGIEDLNLSKVDEVLKFL